MQLSSTRSGLLVAENAADFRSVSAALKAHDPDLRLVPQHSDAYGTTVYKVFIYRGADRPAEFLFGWWDENLEPLPLSHRIVDEVKRLDMGERGHESHVDPDVSNEKLVEERRQQASDELDDAADEFAKLARRSPAFHRGIHLRRNREGSPR